jgi:hypothetical protein
MFINTFFEVETTPAYFIHTQDETNNELIETYQDYQSFINNTFLDANVIDAFCKASEHSFNTMLKINSSIFAKQIGALALYNLGQITKKEVEEQMVDFCIFSKKETKINKRLLKKTIHTIEKLYSEILTKKTLRQNNKLCKKINSYPEKWATST